MSIDSDAAIEAMLRPTPQSPPLLGTESAALSIARVKYTHDAMIDLIIQDPGISQGKIAKHFGYTQAWVSRIFNSDAFQQRLAVRKHDLVDPSLALTLDERMKALASRSADILLEKLEQSQSPDIALKTLELTTKALGYGARSQNLSVQQNFIVPMPAKAESATDWIAAHSPDLARLAPASTISDAKVVD
jgi:DNA-binding MarR family transcriptional regulator